LHSPEEAQAKAERVAETIHRLADGDQARLRIGTPTAGACNCATLPVAIIGACGVERIIKELEPKGSRNKLFLSIFLIE